LILARYRLAEAEDEITGLWPVPPRARA
jgi:hypothetical protein